jgi:hypothetical protein
MGVEAVARAFDVGFPARFGVVLTIAEAAVSRERLNVGEHFFNPRFAFPELQLAQARRVDD